MASVVKYTIDTSFAVKGLVPPRRKKRDEILEEMEDINMLYGKPAKVKIVAMKEEIQV